MTEELRLGPPVDGREALDPRRGPLEGRFVSLEPIDAEVHGGPLWRAAGGAERVWTYLPYGPFAEERQMREWLRTCTGSEDPRFYTVVSRAAGPIGMASFLNVDTAMRHLELGHIWYAPGAQRTEANTETVHLMLREAFDVLGHRRVEWKCDALNARSRAAALRLGFTFEGVFRNHMIVKGRNRNTAWYAMIDEEWPRARSALERWLEAEPTSRPPLASLRDQPAEGQTLAGPRPPRS
ncbi:MAG TPA: GNAT family protein [Actinomycetota bacterium]|jgi:RimJ/RimL family protein N-acetyltransferase|nr:GNAT family protein [Actinomycetota bacterium]